MYRTSSREEVVKAESEVSEEQTQGPISIMGLWAQETPLEWLSETEPGETLLQYTIMMFEKNLVEKGIRITRDEVAFEFEFRLRLLFGREGRRDPVLLLHLSHMNTPNIVKFWEEQIHMAPFYARNKTNEAGSIFVWSDRSITDQELKRDSGLVIMTNGNTEVLVPAVGQLPLKEVNREECLRTVVERNDVDLDPTTLARVWVGVVERIFWHEPDQVKAEKRATKTYAEASTQAVEPAAEGARGPVIEVQNDGPGLRKQGTRVAGQRQRKKVGKKAGEKVKPSDEDEYQP